MCDMLFSVCMRVCVCSFKSLASYGWLFWCSMLDSRPSLPSSCWCDTLATWMFIMQLEANDMIFAGQITIIPKPECFRDLGGASLTKPPFKVTLTQPAFFMVAMAPKRGSSINPPNKPPGTPVEISRENSYQLSELEKPKKSHGFNRYKKPRFWGLTMVGVFSRWFPA